MRPFFGSLGADAEALAQAFVPFLDQARKGSTIGVNTIVLFKDTCSSISHNPVILKKGLPPQFPFYENVKFALNK
jgi:hypothetical protein